MSRAIRTLLLILLIQCGITAAVYWTPRWPVQQVEQKSLAPYERDRIEEVRIGDDAGNEALLLKIGERWLLPDLQDLPANQVMIEKLLDSITSVESGWPIAQSVAARQRFQVADYLYQRRLTLLGDGATLGAIYLGTSPGFRKVHARNEQDDAIYSIVFNVSDAPGTSSAWVDRKLLQVRTPLRITADAYSVHRQDSEWRSGSGLVPDERELQALLSSLRSLQVDGLANEDTQRRLAAIGAETGAETGAAVEAELILQIESLSGNITLQLFSLDDRHFINSSEYPFFFNLSAYDFDRLTGIDFLLISGGGTAE